MRRNFRSNYLRAIGFDGLEFKEILRREVVDVERLQQASAVARAPFNAARSLLPARSSPSSSGCRRWTGWRCGGTCCS